MPVKRNQSSKLARQEMARPDPPRLARWLTRCVVPSAKTRCASSPSSTTRASSRRSFANSVPGTTPPSGPPRRAPQGLIPTSLLRRGPHSRLRERADRLRTSVLPRSMKRTPLNLPPLVFGRGLGGPAGDGQVNPGLIQFGRGSLLNVKTQLQPGKSLLGDASENRQPDLSRELRELTREP